MHRLVPCESEVLGVSPHSVCLMATEFENLCAVGRLSQSKGRKTRAPCALKAPLQTGVCEAIGALGLVCSLPCNLGWVPSPSLGLWILICKVDDLIPRRVVEKHKSVHPSKVLKRSVCHVTRVQYTLILSPVFSGSPARWRVIFLGGALNSLGLASQCRRQGKGNT